MTLRSTSKVVLFMHKTQFKCSLYVLTTVSGEGTETFSTRKNGSIALQPRPLNPCRMDEAFIEEKLHTRNQTTHSMLSPRRKFP